MSFLIRAKKRLSRFLKFFLKKKRSRIGIYGPPNAGKTTLANRIVRDWIGDAVGPVSEIPHETRRARRKENITITGVNGSTITIDIVDTPGVTTKIDYHEFLEYGLDKDEAIVRAREATEGVAEAMHWLREDIDGVIYVLDSTLDPFLQVNIMMVGIIESRKLPVIIVANKIDLPDAAPARIRSAFPQHPVVPISGLEGKNVENLYEQMTEYFV
jgi:GTP-binding protein Era